MNTGDIIIDSVMGLMLLIAIVGRLYEARRDMIEEKRHKERVEEGERLRKEFLQKEAERESLLKAKLALRAEIDKYVIKEEDKSFMYEK